MSPPPHARAVAPALLSCALQSFSLYCVHCGAVLTPRRSLISGAHSFDTAAAAADAAPQLQQQQLSAADRQLLEKLVGIMTKEGKKSRARRLLLDAMHIIKQQVAKGQHA